MTGSYSLDELGVVVRPQEGQDHVAVPVGLDGVTRAILFGCVEPNQ